MFVVFVRTDSGRVVVVVVELVPLWLSPGRAVDVDVIVVDVVVVVVSASWLPFVRAPAVVTLPLFRTEVVVVVVRVVASPPCALPLTVPELLELGLVLVV